MLSGDPIGRERRHQRPGRRTRYHFICLSEVRIRAAELGAEWEDSQHSQTEALLLPSCRFLPIFFMHLFTFGMCQFLPFSYFLTIFVRDSEILP